MDEDRQLPGEIRVRHGTHMVRYRLDRRQRARPGEGAGSPVPGHVLEATENAGADALPVYRREPDGEPAVATGRVYLRADSPATLDARREAIEALGFEVESVPGHAPHTCWLHPRPGRLAECLGSWPRLLSLPGVVRAAARRGPPRR